MIQLEQDWEGGQGGLQAQKSEVTGGNQDIFVTIHRDTQKCMGKRVR